MPMVTTAQSAANWRNTHSCGSHAFTHTFTSTQVQKRAKRQLSYYRIWNQSFYFQGTRGRGNKLEYPELQTAAIIHLFFIKCPTDKTGVLRHPGRLESLGETRRLSQTIQSSSSHSPKGKQTSCFGRSISTAIFNSDIQIRVSSFLWFHICLSVCRLVTGNVCRKFALFCLVDINIMES